jgi:hypothetical protein
MGAGLLRSKGQTPSISLKHPCRCNVTKSRKSRSIVPNCNDRNLVHGQPNLFPHAALPQSRKGPPQVLDYGLACTIVPPRVIRATYVSVKCRLSLLNHNAPSWTASSCTLPTTLTAHFAVAVFADADSQSEKRRYFVTTFSVAVASIHYRHGAAPARMSPVLRNSGSVPAGRTAALQRADCRHETYKPLCTAYSKLRPACSSPFCSQAMPTFS